MLYTLGCNFLTVNRSWYIATWFVESISQRIESTYTFKVPRSMRNEIASTSEDSSLSLAFTWCYCKRCSERYEQIIESLDDILVKNRLCLFTTHKMKFSLKDFFSKCDQVRSFLRIWSHLLKKFLMENLIFCAVLAWERQKRFWSDFQSC